MANTKSTNSLHAAKGLDMQTTPPVTVNDCYTAALALHGLTEALYVVNIESGSPMTSVGTDSAMLALIDVLMQRADALCLELDKLSSSGKRLA